MRRESEAAVVALLSRHQHFRWAASDALTCHGEDLRALDGPATHQCTIGSGGRYYAMTFITNHDGPTGATTRWYATEVRENVH